MSYGQGQIKSLTRYTLKNCSEQIALDKGEKIHIL